MHELAANAAVHSALCHSEGSLTINWRQAEDDGLIIEWDELTKRNAEPRKGFGTILLSAVLEKQLGGKISREWRDRGLHIAVELPALNRVGASLRSKP
jgi:two-component sensor histidine kinase